MTVVDRPAVRDAIERSAEPRSARLLLARLDAAHPELAGELHDDPLMLDAIIAVSVASQSLFRALEQDPDARAMLRAEVLRDGARPQDGSAVLDDPDPARELRRWKRREIIRIAGRDLVGLADLRTVGVELSELADKCLELAVMLAAPTIPMAVVGMGKLGGGELNYASDVDVLFVHEGADLDRAERAAQTVLRIMGAPDVDGIVFRTDAALRPEGRAGALSRTLQAYAAYWERWAQTWELQALIKARPLAGDRDLGAAFVARAARFVWPDVLDPDAVREVRAMKARTEEMLQRRGVADRELKRGHGGIRDIEFAVQLLQLVHGRSDPAVRSRNTLEGLE